MTTAAAQGSAKDATVETSTASQRPDDYSRADIIERLSRKVTKAEEQLKDAKAALAAAEKEG